MNHGMPDMIIRALAVLLFFSVAALAQQTEPKTDQPAREALERAGAYFRDNLGVNGTYVWRYSPDGAKREGEGGSVSATEGWVQPPGTPAVGAAFLRIFEVTGNRQWLDAAEKVATALVDTQLLSGGWFYAIETDPDLAKNWCYRALGRDRKACRRIEGNRQRNRTVMDDNNTASVLAFLIWFDEASGGRNGAVRDAIDYGLERLLDVQYPNGAVPAFFSDGAPGADVDVAAKAVMPPSWAPTWQKPDTPPYFIINDNLPRDTGRLFLLAYGVYRNPAYLRAAMRIGDFLVAAQLPHPQQGWAQQYDRTLQPVWGRKFEPPALASSETAGSISYLLELYQQTHKARYLEVAKSAGEWLRAARLPDDTWARFYELNTNRPLYVDNDNKITFDTGNLLGHYNMKNVFEIPAVLGQLASAERDKQAVERLSFWEDPADELDQGDLTTRAVELIETQDPEGRWIDGDWVDGARFVENVFVLARFVALENEKGL